jgi:IclR family pca regulon transcriptional regulator
MPDDVAETLAGHERDDGFVQSLARGLLVIEAFRPGRERLTMAQIAAACGLTRAGARRILLTLNRLGYVGLEGRYFQLTPRILELGAGHVKKSLWEIAQPVLEEVANALNESASAGVLEGPDVVYTVRARPAKVLHVAISPGAHLPAFANAMGRVLLAALPEPELESYLDAVETPQLTPFTVQGRDALRDRIACVREQGWACARAETDERYACVAVPLVARGGRTLAALNASMGIGRADADFVERRVVPDLQHAARTIAAAL